MDTLFASHYDAGTSTLELSGSIDQSSWATVHELVDRAFRRTACHLTIDLTRTQLPPHTLGNLVHLCNSCYPGTIVRVPRRPAA